MKQFITILALTISMVANAQDYKRTQNWYFGEYPNDWANYNKTQGSAPASGYLLLKHQNNRSTNPSF